MAVKQISVRIEEKWIQKLRAIARREERSLNGQIYVLIRRCVEEYEEKNGTIEG